MSLKEQMQSGKLYIEFGHADKADQAYEQVIAEQRQQCKARCFEFNHTNPLDTKRKDEILRALLGDAGEEIWMEEPIHFAYGSNTHIGHHFYANFNSTFVDDGEIFIGDYVLFGPNVMVTTTGHPVYPAYRDANAQFSLPVHIGSHVWIGGNVAILPGVTIGENSVIGAGSVVTHDIPANTVAVGVPCRVVRQITEEDRKFCRKGVPVNEDWNV